jgi:serine/threonine-protein phosphatase PGAM5
MAGLALRAAARLRSAAAAAGLGAGLAALALLPAPLNWDKRGGEQQARRAAQATQRQRQRHASRRVPPPHTPRTRVQGGQSRTLILVRHGQYANSESSHDDALHVLTPLGRRQAEATGVRLRLLLGDAPVVITHSTMARAAETAALIGAHFPGVPLRACELLREGAPVRPEPDTWQPREADVWQDGARIEAAFRKHVHRADAESAAAAGAAAASAPPVEILVCHGNVIRYCTLRALQLPPEAWLRLALANGSVTKLSLRANGHVSLHALGDTGHLPPAMITHN